MSKIQEIQEQALKKFETAATTKELYDLKVEFLGKSGAFTEIMKGMKDLSAEERPLFGKKVNEAKIVLEDAYLKKETDLKNKEINQKLAKEWMDLTLPGPVQDKSTQHPISLVLNETVSILARLGYSVRLGPLIEKDFYNFEALNMPKDHPAREMQDTFYVGDNHVLRTHTSPIQIHTMEKEKPPIRIIGPGAVFRCDSDISHAPMFHQIEALYVDRKVSMADLKGTIAFMNRELFGSSTKTRFRPSFFPFTEPSAEFDCSCPFCNMKGCRMCGQSGWIELGGSGLVHPNVLKHGGIDPNEWQGLAFGFGIERMSVIKYGVDDIRLFCENDRRFLEQFPS